MKNNIFEVDIKGLRQLQAGKPIWFVIRELVQNALDENITECIINFKYEKGRAYITVIDDNPTGFTDLSDAYTLFKSTRKRFDTSTRGRFNLGEKQVLCLCDSAKILTTTGGLLFDSSGRHTLRKRRDRGSEVSVVMKMTKEDYLSCINYCSSILVPRNITLILNYEVGLKDWFQLQALSTTKDNVSTMEMSYKEPYKVFEATLQTEVIQDDIMKRVNKKTLVHLHNPIECGFPTTSYIYEMGIPVCEIDCAYSIDVQQKIPLNSDRDNVLPQFLKILYGEVLNQTFEEIKEDNSSDTWIRLGASSDRIKGPAVKNIFNKRYGDKAVIANPFDKRSIDAAITSGYRVIYSTELNGEEHKKSKEFGILKTSSEQFPVTPVGFTPIVPDDNQKCIAEFCKKVFKAYLSDKKLTVLFIESTADMLADFCSESCTLRFNLINTPKSWFYKQKTADVFIPTLEITDLIIHELAHLNGTHYEKKYLDTITRLGAQLTHKALQDPKWFEIF